MPHGRPLLAGAGAMVLGAMLMWSRKPRWSGWIALIVSPAALFPCIYSIMGEWDEVVSLYGCTAQAPSGRRAVLAAGCDTGEDVHTHVSIDRDRYADILLDLQNKEILPKAFSRNDIPFELIDIGGTADVQPLDMGW